MTPTEIGIVVSAISSFATPAFSLVGVEISIVWNFDRQAGAIFDMEIPSVDNLATLIGAYLGRSDNFQDFKEFLYKGRRVTCKEARSNV